MNTKCLSLLLTAVVLMQFLAVRSYAVQPAQDALRPIEPSEWSRETAAHLLDRAGFGGTPGDIDALARLTPTQAVNRIVNYHQIPQDERLVSFVNQPYVPPPPKEGQTNYERNLQVFFGRVAFDNAQIKRARDHWLERMLVSTRPLEEKLTLFWHGHLTTSNAGAYMSSAMIRQNELFREHAAGNVGELLLAISKDPAMLRYLNNNANVKGRPNENYARELMELFALGEGNYSEEDIKEAARAFTGWTSTADGAFLFRRNQHDEGEKTILGMQGNFDGSDVVEILVQRPEHARFICEELFRFFVHDHPTDAQLNSMIWTYRVGGNRIRPVLMKLFQSEAFYSEQSVASRVKSPVEYMVSMWKSMELSTIPQPDRLDGDFSEMGQVLFYPPTVEGWEGGHAWITSSTLLARYNVAGRLILGEEVDPSQPTLRLPRALNWIPIRENPGSQQAPFAVNQWISDAGVTEADEVVSYLEGRFLRTPLSDQHRQDVVRLLAEGGWNPPGENGNDDQQTEYLLRRALHLVLCTPEFQVH